MYIPGTKIVYEKAFLMNLRNSPISKTPPSYGIPEALMKGKANHYNNVNKKFNNYNNISKKIEDEEHQFQMDI